MTIAPLPQNARIVVVGAGVVGVSTAYALAQAGFSVSVVTAGSVGDGATSGNAGLLVPPDSVVWPSPANRRSMPAALLGRRGAIHVSLRNLHTVPWGARFLMRSTPRTYAAACSAAHELSCHSLDVTRAWADAVDVALDPTGMVFLLPSHAAIEAARRAREPLIAAGETYGPIERDRLAAQDPAYATLPPELRVLYAPSAAQGDSRAFTVALAGRLRAAGVAIHEHRPATRLRLRGGRLVGVTTGPHELDADAVIVAAGIATRALVGRIGVATGILPVKGYAATVPVLDAAGAPTIGGVLDSHHVAYSRMGQHVRFSTGAEIGCADRVIGDNMRSALRTAGESLFPGALDWSRAAYRAEHRPMTPSGLPLIGPTAVPGLYLNSGHGSLGWTQAAGSADLLTQLIAGARPALDPTPFLPH